jgi:chromosomal replication initiator protein
MPSKKKDIWRRITQDLRSKLSKSEYRTWLSQAHLEDLQDDVAVIAVPNNFIANWLHDKYLLAIKESFETILRKATEIHVTYHRPPNQDNPSKTDAALRQPLNVPNGLNPMLTFDRFITGRCNRFAWSSSQTISDQPADQYNPMYIFSQGSLGKTHLLHSIGNRVLAKNPASAVCYLSSNRFTSDFTRSIKSDKLHEFRTKYCNLDMLLFDDVQLLANRKRTQEEFLFIFNSLYGSKKQLVITGDRPPNEFKGMSPQLRSRLGCGLIAEIKPPDHQTKVNIIKKNSEESQIDIPDDVVFFLAKSNHDIKRLLKSIVRLEAYASLNRVNTNISTVKSIIDGQERIDITVEDIKNVTAGYFNISVADLVSNKKKRVYSYPRQLAMYLARKYTDLSFKEIGDGFGHKDHSTVIYAVRRIERYKDRHREIRDDLKSVENLLG